MQRSRGVAVAVATLAAAGVAVAAVERGGTSHGFPSAIACTPTLETCRSLPAGPGLHRYRLVRAAVAQPGSPNAILGIDAAGAPGLIVCARPERGALACRALPGLPPSPAADGIYAPG